jgi:hypothetical protein
MLDTLAGTYFPNGFPWPVLLRQTGAGTIAGKRPQTAGSLGCKRIDFHGLKSLGQAAGDTTVSGESAASRCLPTPVTYALSRKRRNKISRQANFSKLNAMESEIIIYLVTSLL